MTKISFLEIIGHGSAKHIQPPLYKYVTNTMIMENIEKQGQASAEVIFANNTEFNRFGLICAVILIVGCSGGLAVGLGGVQYLGTLIAAVIPTMITLSLLIAVAPMKYIMISGITATIINFLMIAYFLIA
ncbi:hypothetical protein OAK35_00700 [Crocinitomicaceae bacterium]|nr:hypothetical protein [Crocinitomicaceae bacterium]MDC0257239.1 hypothetical protein [Crocinitomicaceae bacterium]